jgi:dipeptidyl aminopeptidase/acylaminoacyl peptidase
MSLADGKSKLLATGRGRIRGPAFHPSGDRIAYLDTGTDGRAQVWVVELDGTPPVEVSGAGSVTALAWSRDGHRLAVCALEAGSDPLARRIREYHDFPVAADGLGLLEPEGPGLYIIELPSGETRQVAGGPYTYASPAFSPDGHLLACGRVRHFAIARERGAELMTFGPADEARVLARDLGWAPVPAFDWSPDSSSIAYVTTDLHVSGSPGRIAAVHVGDLRRTVLSGAHDRSPGSGVVSDTRPGAGPPRIAWTADGEWVIYLAADRGSVPIFRCAADGSGRWEPVTHADRECVAEFSITADGSITFVAGSDTQPDEVWHQPSAAAPRRLTDIGRAFWSGRTRPPMRPFTVQVGDGPEADAWIHLPAGPVPHPAVLNIHGGPHGMFGYALTLDVLSWVDAGWAVIQVNPPGSTGYGYDVARSVWGDWGGRDLDYQFAAVDHCIALGLVDPDRLAVTGTSYGGFVVDRIVTLTDRFRCGVTEAGTSDFISVFGTSDFGLLYEYPHLGAAPWRAPEAFVRLSPIMQVERVRTPLLILHGLEDHRQPVNQSIEWFTGLRMAGVEAVLVLYPDDTHFLRAIGRPSNRAHRLDRIRSWIAEHFARVGAGTTATDSAAPKSEAPPSSEPADAGAR